MCCISGSAHGCSQHNADNCFTVKTIATKERFTPFLFPFKYLFSLILLCFYFKITCPSPGSPKCEPLKSLWALCSSISLAQQSELWEVQEIIYIPSLHVISPAIHSCRIVLPYSISSPLGSLVSAVEPVSGQAAGWPRINLIASDHDLHSSQCPATDLPFYFSVIVQYC